MAKFMIQASYTSGAWAAMVKNPVDRLAMVNQMMKPLGVIFKDSYFAFGDYDIIIIAEAQDNKTLAAGLMAAVAGGALSKISTTVLMEPSEAVAAMKAAGTVKYAPPTA